MKAAALRKRPASQPVTTRQKNPAGRDWLRSLDRVWRAMSSPAPHACVPLIEEFEPRLLYSADFAASGLALAADCQVTEQRVLDDSGEFIQNQTSQTNVTEQQHELIIIDASVPDIDGLVAGLDTNGRSIEIVILDAGKDGIKQISAALAGRTDLSAVHIFSHGSDATLQLGSTTLNNSQLDARSGEIARWGDSLSGDGDILLYGCDVAQSEDGRALIDTLARLTGADVAASEDVTGNVLLGGNWNLEYSKGTIEVNLALTRQAQLDWSGLLNVATLQSAQDTYIVSATGNNYGASASLNFDASAGGLGNQRLLLQFDLSSIPAGATINSASLQMQATAITGGPVNLEVHEVLQAWTEGAANGTAGAANWNERIAATNWTTAGGDFNAVAAATLNTGVTGQHSWDITALAQAWYGGTANNGIIVGSPDGGGATVTYDSKEGATAPQLVIDYTPAANNAPIIAGITATTNINDTATATPFSAVTIGDVDNPAQMQSVSITLDLAAKGTLSNLGGGAYDAGTGVYSFSGTAAAATTAVQGLVFTPAANRVTPGSTETTTFTISVSDGIAAAVTNNATTVVTTSVNDTPTLGGITATTNINDTATATPFSAVTIGDVDNPAQTQSVSITLDTAAKGALSNLGGGAYDAGTGVYSFSGTAAAATTAVQGLVFTPAANRVTPGSTETTTFTISVSDGIAAAVTNNATTVVTTSVNDTPTLGGITATTNINDTATATPFSAVTIGDVDNPAQTQSVSITLDTAAKGALSNLGGGAYDAGTGVYSFSGTAAAATTAVQGLVFTPAANRVTPGSTETTTFTISVSDGIAAAVTDNTTTVVSTAINDAPTLGGITALTAINDTATATPFSAVTLGDVDSPAQTQTVSITLDLAAKGTLSNLGGGAYNAGTGVYTFSGTAAAATTAVQGLVFTPAANRVTPGSSETTTFTISVSDGVAAPVTDNTTTVVSTAINDAPTLGGITALTAINDTATTTPFSAVTLGDVDSPAQTQSVSITLDLAAKGTLSNLGGGAYDAGTGVYSFSGTAAAATTAVQGLVFTPAANRVTPGSTETTTFTISVSDGIAAAVTNNATTITSSNVTFPPPPTPAPPEPASPPPVVENTVTAADTEPITQNSKEIEPLPIEAKASDVSATTTSLLEEKSLSAASTSASELAKSQGSREGVRANLNPANAAALFNLDPAMLAEFQIGKRGDLPLFDAVTSATENHAFINELDQLRENITADAEREKHIIGASVAAGTGLSIGYVLWLLRGGVLLSSLLSALPAWRFVDPLPVLGRLKDGDDNEDDEAGYDESLESLVIEQPNKEHATPEENKNA